MLLGAGGNLLDDGLREYAYDHANRLIAVSSQPSAFSYAYNALGDRLQQTVNGDTVDYTLDLGTGLTQILSDGTNSYLYGVGRIGEGQPDGWQYHLGDALGSVRELANSTSTAGLVRSFEPFGSEMASFGSAATVFAFTGEQLDGTGLTFLRARYYASASGRFSSRDTSFAIADVPASANMWNYAQSNPTTFTDPTGHFISPTGPQACLGYVFSYGLLPSPGATSQELVDLCRGFFSQSFWQNSSFPGMPRIDCATLSQTLWTKPESWDALFADFICERGDNPVYFYGNDTLTRQLAHSVGLDRVRREYYSEAATDLREMRFNPREYVLEFGDLFLGAGFPLVHILGSFDAYVTQLPGGRIRLEIANWMDLASGTHFVGRFPPEGQARNPLSLEEVIEREATLRGQPAWWVIATYDDSDRGRIVSVLTNLTRNQTPISLGGGGTRQVFSWTEQNLACVIGRGLGRWYLDLLDIGVDH